MTTRYRSVWLAPALLFAALLFIAVTINFSGIQAGHDSDSVLMAFISIDRWTPFYWGDNRYGMPIPLLASFIRDYRWNLLFQTQILTLAALGVVCSMNLFFLHASETPVVARLGAACLSMPVFFVLFRPGSELTRVYLLAHPYEISLAICLLATAMVLRVRGHAAVRLPAALVLAALALWLNYSSIAVLGVLLAVLPARQRTWRETLVERAIALAGTGFLAAVLRLWAAQFPNMGAVVRTPVAEWSRTALRLWEGTLMHVVYPWVLAGLLAAAIAAGLLLRRRQWFETRDLWGFGLTAALFAAAVSVTDWPMRNDYQPRYWTVPLTLVVVAAAAYPARALFEGLRAVIGSKVLTAAIVAMLLVTAGIQAFGFPSARRALEAMDSATGTWFAEAEGLGCTHLLGNYRMAWNTAFYGRAHGRNPKYAITLRSEVVRDEWDRVPASKRKYCVLCSQPSDQLFWRAHMKLGEVHQTGATGDVCRLEP
jgi:hypothetical protein